MNHSFSIRDWISAISWSEWSENDRYEAVPVTGPADLCLNEHLRRNLADAYDWGTPFEKDIFIWGIGESTLRTATKIGGLPYRESEKPWPIAPNGVPLPFVGQINFSNSADLVDTPAEMLLVFADIFEGVVNTACLEWQSIEPNMKLVLEREVPETSWKPHPFHGHIVRVESFPNAVLKPGVNKPVIDGRLVSRDHLLFNYQASEIGRCPFAIQPCDSEINDPICVIASLQPSGFGHPYPWVNDSTIWSLDAEIKRAGRECVEGYPDPQLMFGDGGSLYIYRDIAGLTCVHISEH